MWSSQRPIPSVHHEATSSGVTLTLPDDGLAADVWFCRPPARVVHGPARIEGACEVSIRRFK